MTQPEHDQSQGRPPKSAPSAGWLGPATEYGPLIAFFVTYWLADLIAATAVLVVTTLLCTAATWVVTRTIKPLPVVTALIVLVFGGLTIALADETFIKMKPTIVQGIFAVILLGGLAFNRALLRPVLGHAWQLDPVGWRRLTLHYGLFFAAMAVLNEIVWRSVSTDAWVNFKLFGILGLTIAFTVAQIPLIKRHSVAPADGGGGGAGSDGDRA